MAGRLAIDFGTSNTRAALWDEAAGKAVPLLIPDVSDRVRYRAGEDEVEVSHVPSVIHYDGNQVWVGRQVREHARLDAPSTFRWMKRYISCRLDLPRRVGDRRVGFAQAGTDFLSRVLEYASAAVGLADEEVAFTVPVEAYEHYQEWLTTVCEAARVRQYRLLDEASAAALGYGVHIQANDVYMVFDFGGGTLDVSIVRIEEPGTGGRRCRVLGKGGADIGGATIDGWLFEDLLGRGQKQAEDVRHLSGLLLLEAERAKEELSAGQEASITVADPDTGAALSACYTRTSFEELLEERGLFAEVNRALDLAEAQARERGIEREHIKAVLLVGGTSLIPSVRRFVRARYAGKQVEYHRPLDAVVLGGAAFVGGVDFYDHIQHDYALRYYDRNKGDYNYRTIVPAGTPYPTAQPVCELTVKASQDEQEFLGLDIYEVGRRPGHAAEAVLDLVFDSSGAARFQSREDPEAASHFWVNEQCPCFIHAHPKAAKGEKRFAVRFTIDGNKRLCVTVFDNRTGKVIMRDHPVVKLR